MTLDAAGVPATGALSYFSRLADATTFGERATDELHRRGTTTAQTVAAITDGAGWCQGVIDLHRPDAVRMLDVPHALEHLWGGRPRRSGAGVSPRPAPGWGRGRRRCVTGGRTRC